MPRNTAQQLYDVGYVVYRGEREGGREERGKEKGRRMPIEGRKVDAKERRDRDKEVEV